MTKISPEQLALHEKWLRNEEGGERLVLLGADLRGADLTYAQLRGANLFCAKLGGADLTRANLTRAKGLNIAADSAERLKAVATAALADDAALEMKEWHTCETTHCIAGWAIAQAGELGRLLERAFGPQVAGLMLLGPEAHCHFFDDNDTARAWLWEVLR